MLETKSKLPFLQESFQSIAAPLLTGLYLTCFLLPPTEATAESPIEPSDRAASLNETELEDRATSLLKVYCASCHGSEREEGQIRLTDLETIDPLAKQQALVKVQEVLELSEMPPNDAPQPRLHEKKIMMEWLKRQLTGDAAKALAEKLRRFEYGNTVNHRSLFSGEHVQEASYTPDRRWLISEFIFNEKINRLLNYEPTRTIYGDEYQIQGDSGVHWSPKTEWGNKFRRTITNPFLLPSKVGVRYSSHDRLTTGHLLTMVGNAKRVADHMTSESIMKSHYPKMYAFMKDEIAYRETMRNREAFLSNFHYLDRLLREIYSEEHELLLPELVRQEITYPGPPRHSTSGIQKRHENLEFLDRFDREDTQAILRGIRRYKQTAFTVAEDRKKPQQDNKGNSVWFPYTEKDYLEFDQIISDCEKDWFIEGVSGYRIKNRIVTMKLFFDTWEMNGLYKHIANGDFEAPEYRPLSEPEMMVLIQAIKTHRKTGDHYSQIVDKCLQDWQTAHKANRSDSDQDDGIRIQEFITELFNRVFERPPTDTELSDNRRQLQLYIEKIGKQKAIAKLIESMILSTEFAYRKEFGAGEPDRHGRRMMPARDASYALAYTLTDSSPDETLVRAAEHGQLNTRQDYEREVRRILARRDQWCVIDESVQAANLNASITNQPIRKLRFFREFFGYPKALEVFKDDSRFGAGRHEQAVSRLIDEADLLVEHILEKDTRVFEELITTEKFFIYHSGDNQAMKAASDQLRKVYDYFNP
ncbi:MAG: DUF1592 domain-containing protein, partial [Rubripirellula sp.]